MLTIAAVPPAVLFIPSPAQGVWHLGPVPIRAYALCILAGIVIGIWIGERRWQARGGPAGGITDVAIWAVPFGVVGARLYHVISSPDAYFGADGDPVKALYIWEGGLGIWGAIALGALGAWIGCRRYGYRLTTWCDALAPGVLVAQAIGRLGNYFNQELFGGPTTLPWGLEIDAAHRPVGFEQYATFQPTFLYELLWNLAAAALLIYLDRRSTRPGMPATEHPRFTLRNGQVLWAYVALYTLGRVWIEALRIDTAEHILGLRLNIWTSLIVGVLGVVMFLRSRRASPGADDDPIYLPGRAPSAATAAEEAQ